MNGTRFLLLLFFPFLFGGIILVFIRLDKIYSDRFPAALFSVILAILLLMLWYQTGRIFSEKMRDFGMAIVFAKSIPLVLTILYIWQTVFTTYENANTFIVRLAHLYYAPLYVVLKMILLPMGRESVLAVQMPPISVVTQILFLAFEFCFFVKGYFSRRRYCNRRKYSRR